MSEQIKILKWFYENHSEQCFKPSNAYLKYKEKTGYNATKKTFNNLLGRLAEKGLLEKPQKGKYRISENGKSKANFILKKDLDKLPKSDPKHQEVIEEITYFLDERKKEEVEKAYSGLHKLQIDFSAIERFNIELADYFEENPKGFYGALEEAIETVSEFNQDLSFSLNIDVDYYKTDISKARDASNLGKPVTIEGTINHSTKFYPEVLGADFECVQCKQGTYKEQNDDKLKSPYKCDCGSKQFQPVNKDKVNKIELKLSDSKGFNEEIQAIRKEEELNDDVIRTFKPGKNIRITGVVKEKEENKNSITPYINILDFEDSIIDYVEKIDEEDKKQVREKVEGLENPFLAFASGLAPDIVCAQESKQVIASSLIGAAGKEDQDGRIHAGIFSNPGMGKSDLLEFVFDTFHDAFLSDGKNATGPGLVGTVEQEDGKFKFKAGKVIKAHNGILLVDEFDKIESKHASALNRPMSSGTVELDKASQNMSGVPAYTSIIAAGNFSEYLDEFRNAKAYLPDHAVSLMDRLDLVLAVRQKEEKENQKITEAILEKHSDSGNKREAKLSNKELVIYREIARETEAYLSKRAKKTIQTWLNGNLDIADSKGNTSFKTDSNRYIETLAKLTKMFAKSDFREEANMSDAKRAVKLLCMCKESIGLTDGETLN